MSDERALQGRHALVCGASGGIGKATALALARMGATLSGLARNAQALEQTLGEARELGAPACHSLVADMEDRPRVESLVRAHLQKEGAIHVLINNTGGPPSGPILDASPDEFLAAFGRHVLGSHMLLQALLPGMRAEGYGRVINIVSTSVREPIPGLGVSNTIRAAMAGWAKTVSMELPPGVTINNVLPGFTDTERLSELKGAIARRDGLSEEAVESAWLAAIPEGRLARPQELGDAIAFLASPKAGYIRGVSLAVDGGRMKSI